MSFILQYDFYCIADSQILRKLNINFKCIQSSGPIAFFVENQARINIQRNALNCKLDISYLNHLKKEDNNALMLILLRHTVLVQVPRTLIFSKHYQYQLHLLMAEQTLPVTAGISSTALW